MSSCACFSRNDALRFHDVETEGVELLQLRVRQHHHRILRQRERLLENHRRSRRRTNRQTRKVFPGNRGKRVVWSTASSAAAWSAASPGRVRRCAARTTKPSRRVGDGPAATRTAAARARRDRALQRERVHRTSERRPTRMSHDMRYKPGCLFTGSSRTVVPPASTIDSDSLLSADTELSKYETRGPGSGFCPVKPREPIPNAARIRLEQQRVLNRIEERHRRCLRFRQDARVA